MHMTYLKIIVWPPSRHNNSLRELGRHKQLRTRDAAANAVFEAQRGSSECHECLLIRCRAYRQSPGLHEADDVPMKSGE